MAEPTAPPPSAPTQDPALHPASDPGLASEVRRVREASRRAVRELGVLTGRFGGMSTTQCHALLEVERLGLASPSALAESLGLDRSTVTRALAPLIADGRLRVEPEPGNRRARPVRLTARGRRCVEDVHRRSDQRVSGALRLLPPEDRRRIGDALALYAEALRRARESASVRIAPLRPRDAAAMAGIIRAVMPEFGVSGPGTALEDEEIDRLHAAYRRPGHAFFVARRGDEVLGGAGIAPLRGGEPDVCELRKVYLRSDTRGLGIGRRLVEECLARARALGYRLCYLETVPQMVQARRLYEALGFERLGAPLGDTGHTVCSGWYAREL